MTWLVPSRESDFDTDLEDIIIQHLYDNWNIADPVKPVTYPADNHTSFRPGFFDYHRPYEITAIQTRTTTDKKHNGRYLFLTDIAINLRAKRLNTDEDPTKPIQLLTAMEDEVRRIMLTYRPNDILGIDDLIYDGYERLYNADDTYAKSDWASSTRCKVLYQKVDTS